MSGETVRLRPHHLLCIRSFEGRGYSPEFVENMRGVVESLESGARVEVGRGRDDICKACRETCAVSAEEMDEAVLEAVEEPSVEGVMGLTGREIREICSGCRWFATCHGRPGEGTPLGSE